jgi:hypothetical protein
MKFRIFGVALVVGILLAIAAFLGSPDQTDNPPTAPSGESEFKIK